MKVADGLEVSLVASEPLIRQPVTVTFDGRGRAWVIQYLQYPNPAGLKPVEVDQWLRTKYDKKPLPPPRGPKGADKITILSDPDENGRFRKAKDFVTGLNLASGMCLGHGGVYVVQPPYLLFYPDRDGDDVPDGDPEVLLDGFGMEDAHAFANSLQWGPDGWLYGAQGSTVYANIRGIEFSQGIWRYHPVSKKFELFAEGGGNTWGLDFDRHGNVIAGTNFGGKAMLHQVQGAYYIKNFAKHGELKNPHAYGYFDHVPHTGFKGGHVTCGGIVYHGGTLPAKYDGQYLAANLLSNALYWHTLEPKGSTFVSRQGGDLLEANDSWFRPIDCLTGPDGGLYIVDWYDKRAAHLDPLDNWDRTNGRIYKLQAKGVPRTQPFDLDKLKGPELVKLLEHSNHWYRREARRIMAERKDPALYPVLKKLAADNADQLALEAFWALAVSGGVDRADMLPWLRHRNADVRIWAVRLLGDEGKVTAQQRDELVKLAKSDAEVGVRAQLACSARRLPGADCMAIVRALLERDEDAGDPQQPLLLWWAVEARAIDQREAIVQMLSDARLWKAPLLRDAIVQRLARRYLAEGGDANGAACVRLLALAPTPGDKLRVAAGMEQALQGKVLKAPAAELAMPLAALLREFPDNITLLRLGLRLGDDAVKQSVRQRIADGKRPEADRIKLIEVLGELAAPWAKEPLLAVAKAPGTDKLRGAALGALQAYADDDVAQTLLAQYAAWPPALRARAQATLASRPASALLLARAVDGGTIAANEIAVDNVRRMVLHKDDALAKLIVKHWGQIAPATTGEKQARIRWLALALGQGKGEVARGKELFTKHCASCHQLFGQGTKLGPDLTTANRGNRDWLLANIIDPSSVIRPEFTSYTVTTTDGRILTGLVIDATPQGFTLVDAKNEKTPLLRERVEEMKPSPVSLMPEKLLDTLTEPEIRDLFAYLQSEPGKKGARLEPPPWRGGWQPRWEASLDPWRIDLRSWEQLGGFALRAGTP